MLPEFWIIKLTKENINIVGGYYNKKCSTPTIITTCYNMHSEIGKYLNSHELTTGHCYIGDEKSTSNKSGSFNCTFFTIGGNPEITTEDFIKYVINKELTPCEIELNYEIY